VSRVTCRIVVLLLLLSYLYYIVVPISRSRLSYLHTK
jgi:hypothetical protein